MALYSNKTVRSIVIVILGIILIFAFYYYSKETATYSSPLNAIYNIDGQNIALLNGKAEQDIVFGKDQQGMTASKLKVQIFGEPIYVDLNGDSQKDAIFFLTEDSGGSGTFFYVAAAVNEAGKYIGLNALLLGDRIAPQTIDAMNGKVAVNYAVRKDTEPMSTQPSIGVTKYVKIEGGKLVEVK